MLDKILCVDDDPITLMLCKKVVERVGFAKEIFGLANEYLVSFWVNDVMYDKKYVFLPETISASKMKEIPVLGKKGVMIT
mgnify:CR=1 FL=1